MVHSYIPCRSRLALRTTSEKSPLTKSALSQLKPSFIWVAAFPNEAISEPFFIQLTAIRDWFMLSPSAKSVTLQGRVAFVFGLAWISLEDTESRERWTEKNKTGIIKAPYFNTWGLVRCNVPFFVWLGLHFRNPHTTTKKNYVTDNTMLWSKVVTYSVNVSSALGKKCHDFLSYWVVFLFNSCRVTFVKQLLL